MNPPTEPIETAAVRACRRILVVDDDVDSATSLALLLEIKGLETATAHDGLEALSIVEVFRPDAVLLDISLPRMDGREIARRMRALPGGDRLLLLALTGWTDLEARRSSREAGFDDHLMKPVDFQVLLKRLVERV